MDHHGDIGLIHESDSTDKQRVLHIYNMETLYNHVANSYVEWQTAVIEAIIRTNCALSTGHMFLQQEHCTWKLSCLLYVADSYRAGQETKCPCSNCRFARELRNYLAHNWTRNKGDFALRGSEWPSGIVLANPGELDSIPDDRYAHGLALYLYLDSTRKDLRDAALDLGCEDPRIDVVGVIDDYMKCVSKSCKEWRGCNPVPEPDDEVHDYERNVLIGISNEIRDKTKFALGHIDLYGNQKARRL